MNSITNISIVIIANIMSITTLIMSGAEATALRWSSRFPSLASRPHISADVTASYALRAFGRAAANLRPKTAAFGACFSTWAFAIH